MAKTVDVRAVQGVLYGIYKALYRIAGESSAAVMRSAAPDILEELSKQGVDFSCVDDIQKLEGKLKETLIAAGMCDDMTFKLEGKELKTSITNCSFFDLTMHLKEEGIPPFGCPFAALTIALAEKNLGKRARLKLLQPVPGGKPGDTEMVVELFEK